MLGQSGLTQFHLVGKCAHRMLGFDQQAQYTQAALIGHCRQNGGRIGRVPQQIVIHLVAPCSQQQEFRNRARGRGRADLFGQVFYRGGNIDDFGCQGNRS